MLNKANKMAISQPEVLNSHPIHQIALMLSCYRERASLVQLLLKHGASADTVNNTGWTCAHNACSRGNMRIVQMLVEQGGRGAAFNRFNKDDVSAFHLAAAKGL